MLILYFSVKYNGYERYLIAMIRGDSIFHIIATISWILIFTIVIVMIIQMVKSNNLDNEERKVAIEERKNTLKE